MGKFKQEIEIEKLKKIIEDKLNTRCTVLNFGRDKIKTLGIVSGGGSDSLSEAVNKKIDCLLIGEAPHAKYHETKEEHMNLILAGHYETETVGVKALMPVLEKKFGIKTVFIDAPPII